MGRTILGVGLVFFVFLAFFWQFLWHLDVTCLKDLLTSSAARTFVTEFLSGHKADDMMTGYEKGVFFTMFVITQFWNLFNARFFRTGRSLLGDIMSLIFNPKEGRKAVGRGFLIIAAVILVGQFIIVNFCGPVFEVEPLSMQDWGLILLLTSPIMIVPDLIRAVRQAISK